MQTGDGLGHLLRGSRLPFPSRFIVERNSVLDFVVEFTGNVPVDDGILLRRELLGSPVWLQRRLDDVVDALLLFRCHC